MENNKKGFMNIQLFGDEPTGATTPETQNTQQPEKDYKHEYEKQLMEIEKLKNAISKTNSENAEYKRKELEKMSDDEKRQKEYQELVDSNNALAEELRIIKLEKEIMSEGFSAEECKELIDSKFAPKTLANILKARVEVAVKSAGASQLKDGTPNTPMGNGVNTGEEKSDFAKRQEARASQNSSNKVEL